jgi:hypothetical protein
MTFKKNGVLILTTALALLITEQLIAVEEAAYTVIRQDGDIEIREYDAAIVAETVVDGEFEDAGNGAFRKLFKYIDGDNQSQGKIAMTAPVSQEKRSEKIAMTSPVGQ